MKDVLLTSILITFLLFTFTIIIFYFKNRIKKMKYYLLFTHYSNENFIIKKDAHFIEELPKFLTDEGREVDLINNGLNVFLDDVNKVWYLSDPNLIPVSTNNEERSNIIVEYKGIYFLGKVTKIKDDLLTYTIPIKNSKNNVEGIINYKGIYYKGLVVFKGKEK